MSFRDDARGRGAQAEDTRHERGHVVSRSKEILSQAAAAPLQTATAACTTEQETWSRQERAHRKARTRAAAAAAADPLLVMCVRCPIITGCRAWAAVEKYTGIAAGAAWAAGIERPAHWVPGHPPRQPRGPGMGRDH